MCKQNCFERVQKIGLRVNRHEFGMRWMDTSDIPRSHMWLMIGQKVTELKKKGNQGNQGNQATKGIHEFFNHKKI